MINWGELGKQVFDWGGDYDIFDGKSVQGGTRTTNNATFIGDTNTGGASGSWDAPQTPLAPIEDPNKVLGDAITTAPTSPNGAAPAKVLNQAGIRNTQLTIDQLPALLQAALAAEQTNKANILGGFNAAETAQRGTYDKSTTTNQQNYDANYMDSIRAGVKGLGNLFNILRGTGAAGGTAQDLVQDTVGGITANDIRTGADTQQANQGQLDSSLTSFLTELKGKRQQAEDTYVNNERAIRRDNASQMQELFGKMAGFYGEADRTGDANAWMARAGELTPQIAQNSMTQRSAYDHTPVVAKAPELAAFSAPSQPNAVAAPRDGQVGSGIFTIGRRDEEERQTAPTALPVGA